jgi:threonylcarbamoyladenosine tRNA methylthiotransferase CDKAL1
LKGVVRDRSRIQLESYGCAMNQGECALAKTILGSSGYDIVISDGATIDGSAGSMIVFTCDVVQSTENRMRRRLAKLLGTGSRLYIAGCLASILGEDLRDEFPGSIVLDTMGIDNLRTSLDQWFPRIGPAMIDHGSEPIRLAHIVPISTGCTGRCSYCITKAARGDIRSYDPEMIIREVQSGIDSGMVEILLTSQDTAAYGLDVGRSYLPDLLSRITGRVTGNYGVRVGMMNPTHLRSGLDELLDAFDHPNLFKFFHIPIQSGSDSVLKMMGRGYSVDDTRRIFGSIRDLYPLASISTDVIVGFPGEKEEDHYLTLEALELLRPDILNVTRYSPRPGTMAERMPGRILQRTQKQRSREIVALHRDISRDLLSARLGDLGRCLVTEIGKSGTVMARDPNYIPVVIVGGAELLGKTVDVYAGSIGGTYLHGVPYNGG